MSSTNRGAVRIPADNYPTPAWATQALLADKDGPIYGRWNQDFRWRDKSTRGGSQRCVLDPCCGDGAILRVVANAMPGSRVLGVEIRSDAACEAMTDSRLTVEIGDFFDDRVLADAKYHAPAGIVDTIITNPPYGGRTNQAWKFVDRALAIADRGAQLWFLLRVNWLGDGQKTTGRASWLRAGNMPTRVLTLERRPSFTGDGRADSTTYAWMMWVAGRRCTESVARVISCDPDHITERLQPR